jgi:hypothetical protein
VEDRDADDFLGEMKPDYDGLRLSEHMRRFD